jgi:hypothetical protein
MSIRKKLSRFHIRSLERSDQQTGTEPVVGNTDALAATGGRGMDPAGSVQHSFPPNYVKQDDGRPRH